MLAALAVPGVTVSNPHEPVALRRPWGHSGVHSRIERQFTVTQPSTITVRPPRSANGTPIDVRERIAQLRSMGWSLRKVAAATGVHRSTISGLELRGDLPRPVEPAHAWHLSHARPVPAPQESLFSVTEGGLPGVTITVIVTPTPAPASPRRPALPG